MKFTIEVPTEHIDMVVVDVDYDEHRDSYSVAFSGQILDQSPEGLTASVQMALLKVAETR